VCCTEASFILYQPEPVELTESSIVAEFRSFIPSGEISLILSRWKGHSDVSDYVLDRIREALKI